MTLPVTVTTLPVGTPLRYVGRKPDRNGVIVPASFAQQVNNSTAVTNGFIDAYCARVAANAPINEGPLVSQTWINEQLTNYVSQSTATTALGSKILSSSLGVANGIAQLDSGSQVPSGQLPMSLVTNSLATMVDATTSGTVLLVSPNWHQVTTGNIGEYTLAYVTVYDPGYPYIVFPFAYVVGWSGAGGSGSRLFGNGNAGLLTVTPYVGGVSQAHPIYGATVCTADTAVNVYSVIPFASSSGTVNPVNNPPINGTMTFGLSGCNWSGSGYVFSGVGLVFFLLVLPAIEGS